MAGVTRAPGEALRFTVAIDGPAAAGKGTIGKAVAERFGFQFLDTGLLYRAVAKKSLSGIDPIMAAQAFKSQDARGEGLRTQEVSREASRVAAIPEVRRALIDFQKSFARRDGGAVLDGRDIATVICPEAEVKLYINASLEKRAERRFLELERQGVQTSYETVLGDLRGRDERDRGRDVAPLPEDPREAGGDEDIHLIDTSEMSITAAVEEAAALVKRKLAHGSQ